MDRDDLLKQAEDFQKRMEEAEKALREKSVTAEAGGGLIAIEGFANGHVQNVFVDAAIYSQESRQMLEDLLKAAFNVFQEKVVEAARDVSQEVLRNQ
ncbi:MAG: YbaB/EbfC family nucleoid-associated protein [Alphaproteobacteria bacterium]|nr:YbaB/EbfC family nucleoid-associated protein [Alphaproteobacteria bacterium]